MSTILVTGAAGFIGFYISRALCAAGHDVVGLDNLNDYYDVSLKQARLAVLEKEQNFRFVKADLADRAAMEKLFAQDSFSHVAHMAAQAGVRYSLDNPHAYSDSNLSGFINILEGCRNHHVKHLVFASSSSVYGANTKVPFSEHDNVDHPVSLYAATKKANELMAHSYAHLYGLPCTGLRFFTVYGPWMRPDLAIYKFTKAIFEGRAIDVYNEGRMQRDFTYIDDIAEGVVRILDIIPQGNPQWTGDRPDPASSYAPYRIYNIGNHEPVGLMDMIGMLEAEIGIKATKNMLPMQPGDIAATFAAIDDLHDICGFRPATTLQDGIREFVTWYRAYHGNLDHR